VRVVTEAACSLAALVRHGEYAQPEGVPSAHLPHPLTPRGEEQARTAAARLSELARARRWQIDPIVDSSSLLRAWQTAVVLARGLDALPRAAAVESFDALVERGLGAGANLTIDAIEAAIAADPRHAAPPPDWKASADYRLPWIGAESLDDAGRRVADHLVRRVPAPAGAGDPTMKIFVGHGGAFRHAAAALGALARDRLAGLSMHHGGFVVLERRPDGGWTHVEGQWKVRSGHRALD
jgi:2,3-bisphosphoglycerate-dependent phosphoglycerate mutase